MVSNFPPTSGTASFTADDSQSLHSQVSGAGDRDLVLLHGLFGMGSNLGAAARALVECGYRTHQLDLPNHGRSPWLPSLSLAALADAVDGYLSSAIRGPAVLLGHSLGGKVAMELALRAPERVAALIVADIAPVRYPGSHDAVFAAIDAVAKAGPASRRDAARLMRDHIVEEGVVQFLALSLRRDNDGLWRWRFNAEGLRADYTALLEAPEGDRQYEGPVLLLRGEHSAYVTAEGADVARQLFPAAEIVEVANTGHWLHAEQPAAFNSAVLAFLDSALSTTEEHTSWT